jgi:RNA polymerase sigma factor (sigma-70 family)
MTSPPDWLLRQLRTLATEALCLQGTDHDLLRRFVDQRDEAAFEALVRRHGPMVLRLCRRLLRDWHDAQDIFQATFLVLARKAAAIRKRASLGCWLHGVAYRLALKVRAQTRKAAARPLWEAEGVSPDILANLTWRELRTVLDEELNRLPEKYRAPLVLHYLEGQTQEEAAHQLGCSRSTLKRRLEYARELLRGRLTRRGLALAAPVLVTLLAHNPTPAGVPPTLVSGTVKAGLLFATGEGTVTAVLSTRVVSLSEGVLRAMLFTKLKTTAAMLLAVGILSAGLVRVARPAWSANRPEDQPKQPVREAQHPEVYALLRLPNDPRVQDFTAFWRTQALLLKSRLVLAEALKDKGVKGLALVQQQKDPLVWLEQSLQVQFVDNSELLRAGMSGHNPEEMATLVNAVVDTYLREVGGRERDKRAERLKKLEKLRGELEQKVRQLRDNYQGLQKKNDETDGATSSSGMGRQLLMQEMLDCTRELRRVRLEKAASQVRLARKTAAVKEGAEKERERSTDEEHTAILTEQERLLAEEQKRLQDSLRKNATEDFDRQMLQRQIAEDEAMLSKVAADSGQLRLDLQDNSGAVTVLERAEAPNAKRR